MTMTPKSLTAARKVMREGEKAEKESQRTRMLVVKDELIELLHQLSLLPPPADRDFFYDRLEDFLTEELFPS
jgi:hypothetical protein